jgi:general secretion pathway protein D
MINILKPYLSQSAQVYAHESKGVLLVCDFPHSLERVSDLIALFDESVFADVKARVFPLQYINAEDAVEQLKNIAEQFGLDKSEISARSRISFLALERLNMVLAVTRNDQVLDFVEAWVDGLDRQLPEAIVGRDRENIFVYYVQYGDADEIVESIRGVFDERIEKDERRLPSEVTDLRSETTLRSETEEISGPQTGVVLGELSGPVRFMIDRATNSIITRCYSVDYPKILSVIEKLDLYPKQVLIEVVIAEVRLSERTKLGVDWKYILSLGGGVTGEIGFVPGEGALPTSGFVFSVASTHRLQAALQAAVDDRNLQILSTPTILASDNKLARINIGDQVPFPTSTRRRIDETATAETIDTTIQYRDTGIILNVIPKINKDGMVRMEISQEVSSLSPERVEGITAPIINTRHTETTLAVDDQQTIVIAGLMRQERSMLSSGVPGINRVPVLRHLFGTTEDSFDNTELLIFITPHVILSREDSNYLTRNFLNRLDEVKAEMR